MDELNLSFDFDKPDFQGQFGSGTIRESAAQSKPTNKEEVSGIIDASANGLDSITNFVSLFTGKTPATQNTTTTPPPPPPNKTKPLLIGAVGLGVVLLLAFLIFSKNGKTTK
ncbi:hypothetical protein [Aureispira sp. CCB-E]|uniref:hypothetical protein n=1 Tax=Aureispira sp. CCB-E TaxID=3051121 RepID=UPI00286877C2|nr:hypothetical protein [Aureispira sp. CCB-E]WMX15283.1 hypothetical protein QP953_02720 [Aureispira sp. CCB-E]